MPAAEAARGFRVPAGFEVTVFAAEPLVRNPIAMDWDNRGRLWVAENLTYDAGGFAEDLRDSITILTDSDGDGAADARTVFTDAIGHVTSLAWGRGGVYVMCPPRLLFIPDRDAGDVPDREPRVVLEGFDVPPENYHNFANGLRFGPDGWLYGRCGASAAGNVRQPEQPLESAIPVRGGMWRFLPSTGLFEALCHGTTNPWGHDWTADGETVFINTVNGHLWQMIPGAHFRRSHTLDAAPLVYEPLDMHADHWHFDTREHWTDSRGATGTHDLAGGGHAHSGMAIYQADQWPAQYRDRLLTINLHGQRVNVERIEQGGSTIVARHEPDMLFSNDPYFRGVELSVGPDGSVYLADWSDTGECHEHTGVHRDSGRIYRISYGDAASAAAGATDLASLSAAELIDLHEHANQWLVRAARRELSDRIAAGKDLQMAAGQIEQRLGNAATVRQRLELQWTAHALAATKGEFSPRRYEPTLSASDWRIRRQAVLLMTDAHPLDTALGEARDHETQFQPAVLERLIQLARHEQAPQVRLALASALQRFPRERRADLATQLVRHAEDANDPTIPSMIWYGLMPLANSEPARLPAIAQHSQIPRVRHNIARFLAETIETNRASMQELLTICAQQPADAQRDVVEGMAAGLKGRYRVDPPAHWEQFLKTTSLASDDQVLRELRVVFGEGRALDEVRTLALDETADLNDRIAALETLIGAEPEDLRSLCETLLGVRFLNKTALQGLSRYTDPGIARQLVERYRRFHVTERPDVIATLVARPAFAAELLAGIESGSIPRDDVSATAARQILELRDAELTERLSQVWGELRQTPEEKQHEIERLKAYLTAERLAAANHQRGKELFDKSCRNCHRLLGSGETIGPDLTGSDRRNLDYILGNVVDPSAVVTRDFQITSILLDDGRVLTGIIIAETPQTVTLQTPDGKVTVEEERIEQGRQSNKSLMPDGLLENLTDEQIRDLVGYLQQA